MNRIFICLLVLFGTKSSFAQVSVGYYPFQSEISITSNTDDLLWGDIRLATNTFFGNITMEPIIMLNLQRKEAYNLYAGAGSNLNFFNAAEDISIINGYSMHCGIRAKPFKKLRNFHCIFEISPYFNPQFDGGLLRSRLGIAYQFK